MRKLYIAMYHYTRDLKNSRFPKLKGLDVALFRKQIQHFSRNFSVVTMEKVIESMLGIHELPPKALLLTFDDGYIDNYVYALPVLEEYGFQGSFFVPGKIIETKKLLDVNKIHCILASADISILLKDVMERVNYYDKKLAGFNIRDIYNQNVANSRYDSREVVLVKQMLQTTLPVQVRSLIINELFEKYVDMPEEKIAQELYINMVCPRLWWVSFFKKNKCFKTIM